VPTPYIAAYPKGTRVQVAGRDILDEFKQTWRYHDPLTEAQLAHAGRTTTVAEVGFYHGGDPLYRLEGSPGALHEACLRPAPGTRYQLVFQFAPWDANRLDELVALEDALRVRLSSATVDGHDFGSGEANIFIITDDPRRALEAYLPLIRAAQLLPILGAAYRTLDGEAYVRVWPPSVLRPFAVI
jgi:hypothetical protein